MLLKGGKLDGYIFNVSCLILLQVIPVQLPAAISQTSRRLFRSDIPLRLSHELIPNQEFFHRRGTQQGRVEVHVKVGVLNLFLCSPERRLVNSGTVRETALKEVIIPPSDLLDGFGKLQPLLRLKVYQRADMPLGKDEHLKWPDRPPGTYHYKRLVLPEKALPLGKFQLNVILKQVSAAIVGAIFGHLGEFLSGFLGHGGCCPYLAMRVWVGTTHSRAFVLENLHVSILIFGNGCFILWHGNVQIFSKLFQWV